VLLGHQKSAMNRFFGCAFQAEEGSYSEKSYFEEL
jgi:hypothetical protein